MIRALGLFAILLGACANGHASGGSHDGAVADSAAADIDSPSETIDSPPGTIDSPPGTIDSPPGTIDSPPGAIDAPPATIDAPGTTDANNCPVQPCTLAPQCGCPANQSCDIDPSDLMGNLCRAVNTPGTETSTCGSFSECAVGYVCLGDSECHRYCAQNSDCLQPRGQCVIQVVDGSTPPKPIAGAVVCSSNCDPLGNAATYCPANHKCGLFQATFNSATHDITDCEAVGTGGQGADCTIAGSSPPNGDDTKCAANTMCSTTNGTTFQCRRVCNVTTPGTTCSSIGKTCIGFNPALAVGGTTYGVCN